MKLKSKKFNDLAKLLPEGVSETTIDKIVSLVSEVIEEEVKYKSDKLQAKVTAFIRMQLDELKEQAMRELELENSNVHDLKVFEEIKSLMTVVLNSEDETSATNKIVQEASEIEQENNVLLEQLSEAMSAIADQELVINKLTKLVKVNESRTNLLKEENLGLKSKVKIDKPSDSGKVYAYNLNEVKEVTSGKGSNEFVNDSFFRLANVNKEN